jgi:hypothetical protein
MHTTVTEWNMINWARLAELYEDFGEDGIAEVVEIFLEEVGQAQEIPYWGSARITTVVN